MREQPVSGRDRVIVALDFPAPDDARAMVKALGPAVSFYKVGLELVLSGGLGLVDELVGQGHKVFLDMKLLDIANTVEHAVAAAARSGVTFLTIHATDQKTLRAAAAGREGSGMKVLGVTVLTSLGEADLVEQGISKSPSDLVAHRAKLIAQTGIDGVVASGHEAARIRGIVGPDCAIVTPGIRRSEDAVGDQVRVMTPTAAIAAGANHIVVGRPVTRAGDPRAAAEAIVAEVDAAFSARQS